MIVEPVGVDHASRRDVDVGAGNALQYADRVAPLHQVLGKAALVEQHHFLARGAVLGGAVLEPVLLAEAVLVFRLDAFGREPVGPLPAGDLAEAGVVLLQALVQR